MFLLNYEHNQNHQNHQNLYLHPFVLLRGMKCLICSSPGPPSARSPIHTVSSPVRGEGWARVVGWWGAEGSSMAVFVVAEGFGGRCRGLVSTWSPPMGTEGSSQNQLKRSRRRDRGDEARIQLHLQVFRRPISLQQDRRCRGFYQQEHQCICGGPAAA